MNKKTIFVTSVIFVCLAVCIALMFIFIKEADFDEYLNDVSYEEEEENVVDEILMNSEYTGINGDVDSVIMDILQHNEFKTYEIIHESYDDEMLATVYYVVFDKSVRYFIYENEDGTLASLKDMSGVDPYTLDE